MSLIKIAYTEYYTPQHEKLDNKWISYTADKNRNYDVPFESKFQEKKRKW